MKIFFAVTLLMFTLAACRGPGDRYVSFAQCVSDKQVKMYGAFWCPHCAKQKKRFGKKAFEKLAYIECDPRGENPQSQLCLDKKIKKYPTWEFSDGEMVIGELELSELAERTGCELPKGL